MPTRTQTLPPQNSCPPVGEEFGSPVDRGLLLDREFAEVVSQLSDRLEATHARRPEELENGEAAGQTLKALGCVACELEQVCSVNNILSERVSSGEKNRTVLQKAGMIATAQPWLKAARIHNSGMTSEELLHLTTDLDAMKEAIANGEIDKLLSVGGITNTPAGTVTKDQLPELKKVNIQKPERELSVQEITTGKGNRFTVVDASMNEKMTEEDRKEFGILSTKIAQRMNELSPDGQPQVMHQDLKMQKTIARLGNAELYEMRMTGKNRFYFTVMADPDGPSGPTARIVILGAHGGDAATQEAFIRSLLG